MTDSSGTSSSESGLLGADSDLSRFLRLTGQVNLDLVGGTAEAIGKGYRAWSRSLTNGNVTRLGLRNGFVEGAIQAWTTTLGEMQDVWSHTLGTLEPAARASTSTTSTSTKGRAAEK